MAARRAVEGASSPLANGTDRAKLGYRLALSWVDVMQGSVRHREGWLGGRGAHGY
jgi:hypothetical protein